MHAAFDAAARFAAHASVRREHKVKFEMIYHAVCGDLQIAEAAARTLVELCREADAQPVERARGLRNAAYVYQRCGKFDECEMHLVEAMSIAEDSELVTHAFLCSYLLAEHYLYIDDAPRADHWHDRMREWAARCDDGLAAASYRRAATKVALIRGRVSEAVALFPETAADVLAITSPYQRATCAALYVHLRLTNGGLDDATDIRGDFRNTLDRVQALGDQDYPVFVAYLLNRQSDPAAAQLELLEYITVHRRECGPLPVFLSRVVSTG